MTVAGHLEGKPPHIIGLYRYLHDLVRQIGPVSVDPQGRGIAFQVRGRSIGVTPLGHILHFRLTDAEDVDAELRKLRREAYKVGAQDATAPGVRRTSSR